MNAVLVPRSESHLSYTTSSDSIINDVSSDLDLTDLLREEERREEQDEKRDTRSEPRVSNSFEGVDNPPYPDSGLEILLQSIDVHAKRLGMKRLEFLSRVESLIRSDRIDDDSSSIRDDNTSGDSESTSSSSGGPVYSVRALLDEINRLFQCAHDHSKEMLEDPKRFYPTQYYERPSRMNHDLFNNVDRPSFCSPLMKDAKDTNKISTGMEEEPFCKSDPADMEPHTINPSLHFDNNTSGTSNYNTMPLDSTFPTKATTAESMRRSLISLSSSSSSSDCKENDESVPPIKTGGSFISYSTEGLMTLKTRSDFNADFSNIVPVVNNGENLLINNEADIQSMTLQKREGQQSSIPLVSKKQMKGLRIWARFFRRLRHGSSRKV
jgi:hypothetical protein